MSTTRNTLLLLALFTTSCGVETMTSRTKADGDANESQDSFEFFSTQYINFTSAADLENKLRDLQRQKNRYGDGTTVFGYENGDGTPIVRLYNSSWTTKVGTVVDITQKFESAPNGAGNKATCTFGGFKKPQYWTYNHLYQWKVVGKYEDTRLTKLSCGNFQKANPVYYPTDSGRTTSPTNTYNTQYNTQTGSTYRSY